jgi:hypothetical protein
MKKVLVDLNTGRMCHVVSLGETFPVADSLQWFDAPDDVDPHTHVFDGDGVAPKQPRPIAELKDRAWDALQRARTQAERAPFTWDGSTFDGDRESREAIQGAVLMALVSIQAQQPFAINWTLADDTVRTLSASDMIAVGMTLAAQVDAAHQKGRAKREAIKNASSRAALAAISWD